MKSVVICGSNKFAKEALLFAKKLESLGVVVFAPYFYTATVGNIEAVREVDRKFVALGLTHDHFHKIRLADVVFIFNKGGYVGNSVTMEMGYAVALCKPIYALSDKDSELCRTVLFSGITSTPEALVKRLK
ncbi:MAG: hypothetical protein EXS51_03490 [Candidatus Taylorbacteria bacterium]|nr:hypothetical protein [Candidatus Taylorbacteria bacterium]